MPKTRDHDSISPLVNTIADNVSAGPERHDQLAIAGARGRAAAFGLIGKRVGCREQCVDGSLREGITMRCQELSEPIDVGPRAGQEDDLHGAGGGSSSSLPQLLTHCSIAAMGMASPVRSYSA